MPEFRSENLNWVAQLDSLRALPSSASRSDQKTTLKVGDTYLTNLLKVNTCFDPAAIEKVRQAAKADPPFTLSYNCAKALARLTPRKGQKSKVKDFPATVHAALDITLSRQLEPKQIEALVKWIIQGNSPETFKESAVPQSTRLVGSKQLDDLDQLAQLVEFAKAEKAQGGGQTTAQDKLKAHLGKLSPQSSPAPSSKSSKKSSGPTKGKKNPSLLLELAAGINPFSQLKSKIKKGGDLTRGDWGLLFLENLGKFLHWLKHPFKWIHAIFKFIGKVVIDALKTLGIYNFVKSVVTLALVALLLWGAWDMHKNGLAHPIRVLSSIVFRNKPVEEPVRSSQLESSELKAEATIHHSTSNSELLTSNSKSTLSSQKSSGISHPPVMAFVEGSDAQETKPYLEQELSGIPPNSIIKACVFQPDFTMSGDMAYRRLMDLQDKKYSVRWGNDKVTVVSLTPTASNLMLKVQTGLDSLLTGASKADFYWEDVRQFHCDEIETTPNGKPTKTIYQCSLFLAENKKPITVQCATTADLIHLVSALEYYLRLSRGTSAPPVLIGGLPYLNQGLRLNNDGVVTVLWAFSPLAKTGLALGDILWSVGKNTDHQQDKTQLESALQNLTAGAYTLYKVTADGWKRAWANRVQDDPDSFRPLRRKVLLNVL